MMYWIQHLAPQPRCYDGREQLRHGLRPRVWKIDQTRLYQTPMDHIDRVELQRRKSLQEWKERQMIPPDPQNSPTFRVNRVAQPLDNSPGRS